MKPIVKKAIAAVAIKEGLERLAEARRPQRKSLLKRVAKLTLIGGAAYGVYHAYRSGLLKPLIDKARGSSSYDESYEGSVTVQRPAESVSLDPDPVGSPTG